VSRRRDDAPRASHAGWLQRTRLELMVALPLTMGLLVAGTGFFSVSMAKRLFIVHGPRPTVLDGFLDQLVLQTMLVALVAAILGLAMAVGITRPLRAMAGGLEAVASGNLRAAIALDRTTADVEWLAGAFNDAVESINRYVFKSMTGAVITLDSNGIVIGSSPAAEAILGFREEEIVGRRFSDVFAPEKGGSPALAAVETAIARRQPVELEETTIASKDGRPVKIALSVSYLRRADRTGEGKGGDAVGVTIGFKDLSQIRELRDRLRLADQLVALGTLTAGVAHELRNPLASIRGLAELLGRDFDGQDPRALYVSTMLDSIDRLNRLVENLLLLSSSGPEAEEVVDVSEVLRDTVKMARLGLGGRSVAVSLSETSRRAWSTRGSSHRLQQALSNIVLNAIQATPDGGVVAIDAEQVGEAVVVRVHNTGSYIEPGRMKQLFVPFFTTKPGGTGLGLAIARQIVVAAGGRIEVHSDEESGTTFTVELPAVIADSPLHGEKFQALAGMAQGSYPVTG
jgi:two-component system, NtrC family, sensor histidine kinase AtoS